MAVTGWRRDGGGASSISTAGDDDLGVDLPDSFLWFTPFGRDRWRIIESSKPDRIAVAADRGLWSCTHEQHRLGPSSGSRDGSEHVDAVFKLDRIHNLLIRR
jgi:hypothetical protein